jgi:hypothetical protein
VENDDLLNTSDRSIVINAMKKLYTCSCNVKFLFQHMSERDCMGGDGSVLRSLVRWLASLLTHLSVDARITC